MPRRYQRDWLGSVSDVTDAGGAAQWQYAYEPFGRIRTSTNVSGSAPENRFVFAGQYRDPETTNLDLRARQYDTVTGRFLGRDPAPPSLAEGYTSAYVYALDDPTLLPRRLRGRDSWRRRFRPRRRPRRHQRRCRRRPGRGRLGVDLAVDAYDYQHAQAAFKVRRGRQHFQKGIWATLRRGSVPLQRGRTAG